MLVCMWISFITLETPSWLLSPLGKHRSTGCTCRSFPSPPQFLQQWSHWSPPQSWVMVMCTKPHTRPFTSRGLSGCSLSAWHWGQSAQQPPAFSQKLNCSWEEEGGGNTGKGTSQPVWRICGGIFAAAGILCADSQEMDSCALERRARGQGGWEVENFVASGGVWWRFDYKEPHGHGKEFLF